MKLRRFKILIVTMLSVSIICHSTNAQTVGNGLSDFDRATDSLAAVAEAMPDDTVKLELLKTIYHRHYSPEGKLKYAILASKLAINLNCPKYYIDAENEISWQYFRQDDYDNSVIHNMRALNMAISTRDSVRMARTYNSLANTKTKTFDYVASDIYRQQALKIYQKTAENPFIIAKTYRELAQTSLEFQLFDDANQYLKNAIHLDSITEEGFPIESDQLANLSDDYILLSRLNFLIYCNSPRGQNMLQMSKQNIQKAYDLAKDADDMEALVNSTRQFTHILIECASVATDAHKKRLLDSCQMFYNQLENISADSDDPAVVFDKRFYLAKYYTVTKQYDKALGVFEELEPQVMRFDTIYTMLAVDFYRSYANYFEYIEDYKSENYYREVQFSLDKRTYNREFAVKTAKARVESDFEELNHRRDEVENMFIKRIYLFGSIVFLVLLTIVWLWLRNRKTNKKLLQQQAQLEDANGQITASIRYAKKIQTAIIPDKKVMDEMFGETLIYWKPLNIVSGDFYWAFETGNVKMLAVADCTGHGVPGAFLSMLGISSLNDIVSTIDFSDGDLEASLILDLLRGKIIESLHQTGQFDEAHDGMDMGFLILNSSLKQVQFAGAYRPLLLIRDGEMKVYNGDRMPISYWAYSNKSFKNNVIDIQSGDQMYLFSDGITDQFGNFDGQEVKYSLARLKKLLTASSSKPFSEQYTVLEGTMQNWMKPSNTEQIDDQLLVGIRIE